MLCNNHVLTVVRVPKGCLSHTMDCCELGAKTVPTKDCYGQIVGLLFLNSEDYIRCL